MSRAIAQRQAAQLVELHDFDPVHGHCRTCGELPEMAALWGCERMNHDSEPASRELLRRRGMERPDLAECVAALVAARAQRDERCKHAHGMPRDLCPECSPLR